MLRFFPHLTIFVLMSALLLSSGCTEDAAEEEEATVTSAAAVASTTPEEVEVQSAPTDTVPETPVEADMPAASGSMEPQSAGELIDGLRLEDIRWDDKGSYFRIVFDLSYTSGETVLQTPHADAHMSPAGTGIEVTLGGIRGISEQPNALEQELALAGDLVTSIERLPAMDDQALVYRINLAAAASSYSLDSLGDPGRVVIDIYFP